MAVDKTIKLGLVWGVHQYEVKTITNSTKYKPGQWLGADEVQQLCDDPKWDVAIADNQFLSILLGQINRIPTSAII